MLKVPPKYFWPGLVIGLLSLTVLFNVGIIMAANSGNGPQPVSDYYAQAVDYDETKGREQAARQLGWQWEARFVDATSDTRKLELVVTDGDGRPVEALDASFELRRPSLAKPVARGRLAGVEAEPGVYLLPPVVERPGLWDVVIEGTHPAEATRSGEGSADELAFRQTMRAEWSTR